MPMMPGKGPRPKKPPVGKNPGPFPPSPSKPTKPTGRSFGQVGGKPAGGRPGPGKRPAPGPRKPV